MSASAEHALTATVELRQRLPHMSFLTQQTIDDIPTLWILREQLCEILRFLKSDYEMLFDLCGVDERLRAHRDGLPPSDYTVVYHLMSFKQCRDIRLKVALSENDINLPTIASVYPNANWYEREAWDMFGINFSGHPNLYRILLPPTWVGHALRKDHPARATEMGPFHMTEERQDKEQEALRFRPEQWGLKRKNKNTEFMFLNLGPNHPSVHGVFRIVLQLDGEVIVDAVPEIGYHHRGAEKMAERQTWHSYIPYTDRIDYLGGVMNNLPYVMAVEKLAGITVPDRARVIRIMMAEMFRISSHLVFYGTFAQDVGQMSPVFYMFSDRERLFRIVEAVTGGRMHPAWFRIGGVAQDLPKGWHEMFTDFLDWMPKRLDHFDKMVMQNSILKQRTKHIGVYSTAEALDWGITGPGLRATGMDFDFRRDRPYGGYDQFDFEVPVYNNGDCYDRAMVRVDEIRQSLRIIRQCVANMPAGPYKADHPATTPPPRERTMQDIETLIHHFVNVSWGPVIPEGECSVTIEATKGLNMYYLTSDGGTNSYRTRIRAPSFPHLQQIPLISRGLLIPDLIAILASIDFVMADVDR
ncbi:MAG: NADH-quinone oxidoreductase subunit C/D [SAR86 cluster bacterium]|jgi:NADH-quinone oxidoreductase subunit C/D|uniref:NADH-quinone oxidoreductase subunit C/D n=1 Tax=SAR86 cluster bacterium TaxID=2030880 RepID=A0A973A9I8_9GAMM|nr:NADH-quinone oxidoreductase subunit C/D [SAR86 cluster bacterium]